MVKCAPSLVSLLLIAPEKGVRAGMRLLGVFLAGRLAAYCLFGFLAGWAGSCGGWLPDGTLFFAFTDLALGALLLVQGVFRPKCTHCSGGRFLLGSKKTLFLAGLLNSVTLCPPLLLALSVAVENGSPMRGIGFFALFFLASSIYLVPISLFSVKINHRFMLSLARIVCVCAGGYFIWRGVSLFFIEPYVTY